jgi:class 3 adenylate cyclase
LKMTAGKQYERRYDPAVLKKVVNLATRLQNRHEETLTESQIEAIGREIGLDPAFVRQALAQLEKKDASKLDAVRRSKLWSLVAAFGLPVVWGGIALMTGHSDAARVFTTLIASIPLAGLLGFLAGDQKLGSLAAIELVLALGPATWPFTFIYVPVGIPFAMRLAKLGVSVKQEYYSTPGEQAQVSREDLLRQLFALQAKLESQKQRKVFLSVDVVGSSQMVIDGPELDVEYSFGQFRKWLGEVIEAHGGKIESAAGDGVMAQFDDDRAAVNAAKQIQTDLPLFNSTRNRLSTPFRVRCGISAGEIPVGQELGLRDVQSPPVYRAAVLQKRAEPGDIVVDAEIAPTALLVLGHIAPVDDAVGEEDAYSWKVGLREGGVG